MSNDILDRLRDTGFCGVAAQQEAADEIERLRAEVDLKGHRLDDALDEIERLRFAGDALAAAYEAETQPQSDREWKITQMWEEARRG